MFTCVIGMYRNYPRSSKPDLIRNVHIHLSVLNLYKFQLLGRNIIHVKLVVLPIQTVCVYRLAIKYVYTLVISHLELTITILPTRISSISDNFSGTLSNGTVSDTLHLI